MESLVSVRRVADILEVPPETLRSVAPLTDQLYRSFDKRYISNGVNKYRQIDEPIDRLKFIQRRINQRLLKSVTLPPEINGGVDKKSIRINALPHVGKAQVVTIDLRKYFPSISNHRVAELWRQKFGTGDETTWILTRLTTYRGRLPQGAPTSTGIANHVFSALIPDLHRILDPLKIDFSVWVDDIAMSGENPKVAINEVVQILTRHGFSVSREKTKIMCANDRQQVTGAVVNRKVSNGNHKMRRFRGLIMVAELSHTDADAARAVGSIIQAGMLCPEQGDQLRDFRAKLHERRHRL